MRRLGAGADGDGVDGPMDSAVIAACLRFVPVISDEVGGVMDGKGSSDGGGMIATGVSPVLGRSVVEKGATAGETTDSFGFTFETAKRRDFDERRRDWGACSERYVDGGDGGVDAGRPSTGTEVSIEGVRGVIGAEEIFGISAYGLIV